eukprot:2305923-Amphidinium_carterae.1
MRRDASAQLVLAAESGGNPTVVTVAEASVQTTPLPQQIEDTDDFVVFEPAAVYVVWRLRDAEHHLPGVHFGLCAWQGITSLIPDQGLPDLNESSICVGACLHRGPAMCCRRRNFVMQSLVDFFAFVRGRLRGATERLGAREPGSQATSAVVCLPAPVAADVSDALLTSAMTYTVDGAEHSLVEVVVALIEPAFLCGKITETCPVECGICARPSWRFAKSWRCVRPPRVAQRDACLRLAVDGEHSETLYYSAGEEVVASEGLVAN